MITLSKTYNPADFEQLGEELTIVQAQMGSASPQHGIREFEYSLALRAFTVWGGKATHRVVDVGGAGSPFWKMLPVDNAFVVDPAAGDSLEQFLANRPRLADAVFCISVLEHVPELDQFAYHLACLVAPGGLLFLTMDYQPDEEPDTKMFHWMRERIFTPIIYQQLVESFCLRDFTPLGEIDRTYHSDYGLAEGDGWGYSAISLALVKRA